MTQKNTSRSCEVCGEPQALSEEALRAVFAIHPDRPIICAKCAVDRKGTFGSRAHENDDIDRPNRTHKPKVVDYSPSNPRPNADEADWIPGPVFDSSLEIFDLFCGPGGFSTGFEWAGFKSTLGMDIHAPSLKTFEKAHPAARAVLGDIREIRAEELIKQAGGRSADVITAGIPCEGFSRSNRNRLSFIDARNFLFLEFLRIADYVKPKAIVIENVQALTSHSEGFFKDQIVGGIEALGYECHMRVLNALDYGVPQRRRRVIFVGLPPATAWTWPRPSHGVHGDFPARTVSDAISDLPEISSSEAAERYHNEPENAYQRFLRGDQETLMNHIAPKHPAATIHRIANTRPGEPMYPKFKQRIRLDPGKPSPTVVSGGIRPQFAHGHPWRARGLTIRERARLQSFPDWYSFEGGVTQGRVQTGDAVPPLMAWRIAEQVRNALLGGVNPERGMAIDPTQLSLV